MRGFLLVGLLTKHYIESSYQGRCYAVQMEAGENYIRHIIFAGNPERKGPLNGLKPSGSYMYHTL
jgi:hypothetical protein